MKRNKKFRIWEFDEKKIVFRLILNDELLCSICMNVCYWVIFKLNWNKLYVYFILYYILEYMNIYVLYKGSNMLILKFEKVF